MGALISVLCALQPVTAYRIPPQYWRENRQESTVRPDQSRPATSPPRPARAAYERALAIFEAMLGVDHPRTRIVRENLASLDD